MASTISSLYLKYINKVGAVLENDRYFQYLFEMTQNGETLIQQSNRILHKQVDETWLTIIEDSLDAINNIIEKPRSFIATNEKVVPVALAKKITAKSVRHLSQNTHLIAESDDGQIHPSKILNVTREETYDLYENRFIFTLLKRLISFIDKRTDVIFWSTGDEKISKLSINNKVDDAYEEIEYKIEMTVKNKQSFAENDSDNRETFMRIDRVRRLVLAYRSSAFYDIMSNCTPVRSPIQRTNLIMKDRNYKKCFSLWQFLERYDDVGYNIDIKDSVLEFDEGYLFQMYTNFINNYVVFKSLLEHDERKIEEAPAKKHKVIKPKFIKKIVEQIVDDYDIPDVEIRKVIIEEVTRAQIELDKKREAERKLKEQQKEKEKLIKEKEREKARIAKEKEKAKARIIKEKEQAKLRLIKEKEKEKERLAKEKELEKERLAKEKIKEQEKLKLAREKEKQKARLLREKELEKERLAKEKIKEKARIQREKELEKQKLAKQKEKEKAKEKLRLAKEKEKQKARIDKAKEKEKNAKKVVKPTSKQSEEKMQK